MLHLTPTIYFTGVAITFIAMLVVNHITKFVTKQDCKSEGVEVLNALVIIPLLWFMTIPIAIIALVLFLFSKLIYKFCIPS